jgi:hypothetical protein
MIAPETNMQEANKAILQFVIDAYNKGDIEQMGIIPAMG